MLTATSFDLLNTIVTGTVDIHVLRLGVLDRVNDEYIVNELLLNSLTELSEHEYITWEIHEDYGNKKPNNLKSYNSEILVSFWIKLFGVGGPNTEFPNPSTILVMASNKGNLEVDKEVYKVYKPLLMSRFGWENHEI